MIHFFRLRYRALLYHLRMQQGFTNAQIRGAILLFFLIGVTSSFTFLMRQVHKKNEELTKEEEALMDSLLCATPSNKKRKSYHNPSPPKKYYQRNESHKTKPAVTNVKYDLNHVDSIQLLNLHGIGPVLAGRIIKFRKALGGFYTKEQLYEVWGQDSTTTKKLLSNFYIKEEDKPLCINVNTADYFTLKDHPYISPQEASAIMKYKKKKGKFLSLSELETLVVQFEKLKYYLCLE